MGARIEGADRLIRKLETLGSPALVRRSLERAAAIVIPIAQEYPPQRSGKMVYRRGPFPLSDKQRRWFFAALRRGEITVPYQREYRLQRGWFAEIDENRGAASVRNDTPHGGFVQGVGRQALFHEITGWPTEQTIANQAGPPVLDAFAEEYRRALDE